MKDYLLALAILFIVSSAFAYTTSNSNQNFTIYASYASYSTGSNNHNLSLQSNTQGYAIASNNQNLTLAIFPQFVFDLLQITTTTIGAGSTGPTGGGVLDFTLSPSFFKFLLRPGETVFANLTIRNTGSTVINNLVIGNGLEEFITLTDSVVSSLQVGEQKLIGVAFTASLDKLPDVYSGILSVTAGNIEKRVIVIVEVKKLAPLFDIKVELDNRYEKVFPGQEVPADIILYNFGDLKPVDVNLHYSIRDLDGNDITFKDETVAVDEQRLIKVNLTIPDDAELGNYLYYGRIVYNGNAEASSSALLEVIPRVERKDYTSIILITIISLLALIIILLAVRHIIKMAQARKYKEFLTTVIKARLDKGYTKAQILKSAEKAGWPKAIVKKILKDL